MTRSTRVALLLLLTLCLSIVSPAPVVAHAGPGDQQAQPSLSEAPVDQDVVILVDVSASVRGLGTDRTARDIWQPLKQSVRDLIELLPAGTRFAVVPFAGGPLKDGAYPLPIELRWAELNIPQDRQNAWEFVDRLQANGPYTWIVPSLRYALDLLDDWHSRPVGDKRSQGIYIFTDGLDNQPGEVSWQSAANRLVRESRRVLPYLWVALVRVGQPPDSTFDCPAEFTGGCPPTSNEALLSCQQVTQTEGSCCLCLVHLLDCFRELT